MHYWQVRYFSNGRRYVEIYQHEKQAVKAAARLNCPSNIRDVTSSANPFPEFKELRKRLLKALEAKCE